jgi:hypothetical protein
MASKLVFCRYVSKIPRETGRGVVDPSYRPPSHLTHPVYQQWPVVQRIPQELRMSDFTIVIENRNVLDLDRTKKVAVTIRGVTFKCDLPSPYGQGSTALLSACSRGAFGAGIVWFHSAGNYGAGEVSVSVVTSYGTLTGTNALPSPSPITTMRIAIDHNANPSVVVTFT